MFAANALGPLRPVDRFSAVKWFLGEETSPAGRKSAPRKQFAAEIW